MKKILLFISIFFTNIFFAQDGTIDPAYNTGTGFDNTVFNSILQSDGKLIVVGNFTAYNGTTVNKIARINTDGTLDTTFNPAGAGTNNYIFSLMQQTDGKLLISGDFTTYNGTAINRIARLNADGTLDTSFTVGTGMTVASEFGQGFKIQPDNKIIVYGTFLSYNGTTTNRIARLNTDGTLDTSFVTGTGFNNTVGSVDILPSGKLIVAGSFSTYNGIGPNGSIVRLNSDGTIDATFTTGTGFNQAIYSSYQQADGKIIFGGAFTSFNATACNRIMRLNIDGTYDSTFNPGSGTNSNVYKIVRQIDGKYLLAGTFSTYNGTSRNRLVRVNNDGSLDTNFQPGIGLDDASRCFEVQSDNKIIVLGQFTTYQGITKNRIVRIGDVSLATNSYNFNSELNVYPNPSKTIFNIEIGNNATIAIFDMVGKEIITRKITLGIYQVVSSYLRRTQKKTMR
jgi:uncharacterized delta-60 repeat protein